MKIHPKRIFYFISEEMIQYFLYFKDIILRKIINLIFFLIITQLSNTLK